VAVLQISADTFVAWLIKQPNANGTLFLERTAKNYARTLRTAPLKLTLALSEQKREVFSCRMLEEFDDLQQTFLTAPNYQEINDKVSHGAFAAGLTAYRRYLESFYSQSNLREPSVVPIAQTTTVIAEPSNRAVRYVDFEHTELCTNCNPISCTVNGDPISCGTWRDLLVTLIEKFLSERSAKIAELFERPLLGGSSRPFLLREKPNGDARQISSGHWVYVKLNIAYLVNLIGKLCEHCGVNLKNVEITYAPKKDEKYETMIQEEMEENSTLDFPVITIHDSVISVIRNDYASGFRFGATALRLLSNKSGVSISENMQSALKQQMFRRNDGVYFLLDSITNAETRKGIVEFADKLLSEYGCFEVPELYAIYADNLKNISSAEDFESFYEQIGNRNVRCVASPQLGNRIARFNNGNVWGIFTSIAKKIIDVTNEEFGGVVNEEDLHTRFYAFSIDLLAKIIKYSAGEKLFRTEINGIVCYQTLEALGLPGNFSDTLAETLERLDELNLTPNEEVLHTALSLALGVNFKEEYNLPDQETYRRLVAVYYKAEPPRKWKYGVFSEVIGS
jgi:hypothetical protein